MSECEHVLMISGVGLEAYYCNGCGLPDHAIKIAQQAATIERLNEIYAKRFKETGGLLARAELAKTITKQAATIERQQAVIDAAKIVDDIPDDDWPIEDIDMPILKKLDALHDALEQTP